MPEQLLAAVLAAVAAAVGGLLAPRVVARLPEPEREPLAGSPDDPAPGGEAGGIEPGGSEADGGEARASEAGGGEPGATDPAERPATDPAERPAADPAERPAAEPTKPHSAVPPSAPPKVPYAALAARPHLGLALAVAAALLAGTVGWSRGLHPALAGWVVLAVLGVTLSYRDWFTHLLPKRLVLPAYPLTLLLAGLVALVQRDPDVLVRVGIGWAAVSGIYLALWLISPRGIGYGDVRLSGVIAIVLAPFGWSALVVGAYGGFVLGAVGGIVLAALRLVDRRAFPFGPFMVLGAWLGAGWGSVIIGPW